MGVILINSLDMFRKIFSGILVTVLVLFAVAPALASPSFFEDDSVSITSPIGDDVYIGGGNVIVESDIKGDLFVGGGMIEINGDIAGDLFIGGGTITVRGNVGDDVRIGGGQITIYGNVGDDLIIGGGTVTITDSSTVRGDLLVGAGDFSLYGDVQGSVKAGFGSGRIKGTIGGDADLRYGDGKLTFADGAKIGGKLDYWALSENDSFADIAGEIEYHKMVGSSANVPVMAGIFAPMALFAGGLWSLVGIVLLGGLMLWLLPKFLPRVVETTKKNYLTPLWQGLLFVIVVPILAMLIAMTGIGIPVSLLMMLGFMMMMMLASIPVSLWIGSYILKYKDKERGRQFGALALGALIYIIVGMVPFVGWFIKLALFMIGVGMWWIDSYAQIKKGNY